MFMAAPVYYTAEMVRQLNAAEPRHWPRYETVHGELLVTPAPAPPHQEIVARIFAPLRLYAERERAGKVLTAPADISWGRDDLYVQPDIFVVPPELAGLRTWRDVQHLLLAIEIISPSSARIDRFAKRRLYQERGVPLYWVVDADAQGVEVWTPGDTFPRVEHERLVWHPDGAAVPLVLALEELFREP
jgi:Uma2 family endonuclease